MSLFPEPVLAPDAPTGLGRAMVGGHGGPNRRQPNDYYPTPAEVTRALLRVEYHALRSTGLRVWEPCGRGGAIKRELNRAGFDTIGTDIVADPANAIQQLDVLKARRFKAPAVVTNPPFVLAPEIILHLLGNLRVKYLALLLKASFFHAEERRALFHQHLPARIHALTWRPDFLGGGAPTMECAWFVWQRGWALGTHYHLLPREADQDRML